MEDRKGASWKVIGDDPTKPRYYLKSHYPTKESVENREKEKGYTCKEITEYNPRR